MKDSTAKIGSNCRIGPNVTIGSNVLIEDGVCIRNSAIFPNSIIRCHAWMENCIVGWKSVVGRWVIYFIYIYLYNQYFKNFMDNF